ncbi:glycoside hydrolase family 2 protein [Fictibacillus terranigra]|uniref:Glycoside hydrolase family 2 TIM barrel-domain containing protein n=1 Tax=Fictibacillus terranigra TaxID=3058424 RepID=A0ABT8E1N4_9BACL|nr:sugar-binding domain-containing protein [Fictibacillus sp. CENA-BCM004]MDN4071786.1 glycoside hydrolase family 2 TIM barrel-domain containing protein [Fictibacillus sp. CENA-BCM004]
MEVNIRKEYPRPQFERKEWLNLNGEWDFQFDQANRGEEEQWYKQTTLNQKIIVPFTYETKASGIHEETFCPYIWYQRLVTVPEEYSHKKTILHFQAADYVTKLWVNGMFAGQHKGGYTAFSFDITNYINAGKENNVVVKIEDSHNEHQPRGKQRWIDKNFGCWYVQSTGIWQTVWLEFLNQTSIQSVKITPDLDTDSVEFDYKLANVQQDQKELSLRTSITFDGHPVKEFRLKVDRENARMKVNLASEIHEWKVMHWSPQHPHLYDVEFTLYHGEQEMDRVQSYFGMRKVSIKNGNILLNNVPIYQKLLLDQGYWEDSHLTPPSEEAIILDIEKTFEMGFNGVRKHMKVEDQRFLYWADKKGLLVWSEMAAAYQFSDEAIQNFTEEWMTVVQQHYNHPSIITWTPFNESWGVKNIYTNEQQQKFTEGIYYLTKSMDPMRPVIVNDGWEHTVSDIITLHDYVEYGDEFLSRYKEKEKIVDNEIAFNNFKHAMAQGYEYKGQPIMISEYGGIAFNSEEGWGYGNQVKDEQEFLDRYASITKAIMSLDYICGFCYTQITDVQQEVNGLLTENRKPKVNLSKIKQINDN